MAKKHYILDGKNVVETTRTKWHDFIMSCDIEDLLIDKTVSDNGKSMVSTIFFGDGHPFRTSYYKNGKDPVHKFHQTLEEAEENHIEMVNMMINENSN